MFFVGIVILKGWILGVLRCILYVFFFFNFIKKRTSRGIFRCVRVGISLFVVLVFCWIKIFVFRKWF